MSPCLLIKREILISTPKQNKQKNKNPSLISLTNIKYMPSSDSPSLLLSPHPSSDPPSTGTWFPYRNGGDFDANLAMILIILICALLGALAFNAAIRCFIRRSRPAAGKVAQPSPGVPALPTLVFSAGMKLAGAEAECAICLSEFVNGEGVRVLPRCKHGFHVKCIEGWLASRSSCPTCRATCLAPSPSPNLDV